MVFASVMTVGMRFRYRLKKRKDIFHELLVFISLIRIEFEFMNMPVLQVLEKIADAGNCRNLDFIPLCIEKVNNGNDFSKAWQTAVELSRLPLQREEKEKLSAAGGLLGTSDIKGQLSLLALFYESFLAYQKKADEEYDKYGKLCITVSVILGAGVFIFLM